MRNYRLIAIVVIVTFICEIGLSLESPVVSNPVGRGTVPATTYRPGLVPSINPIDTSGNLIITGNIAGMRYFRGVVPYGSVTDFSADPSTLANTSGALDSFLRRSSGSEDLEQSSRGLTPFYSPSMTVTTQVPGTRGMVTSEISGRAGEGINYRTAVPQQEGYYQREYAPQAVTRPLSLSRIEMEKIIQQDAGRVPLGAEPVTETQSFEQFWRGMGIRIERRTELGAGQNREVNTYGSKIENRPDIKTLLGLNEEPEQSAEIKQEPQEQLASAPGVDVYELMKNQMVGPDTGLGDLADSADESVLNQGLKLPIEQEPNKPASELSPAVSTAGSIGAAKVYKSFAAFRDDRFNQNMSAAENYMKEGRFYRAANAYTLATFYKPDDPLGYAGKSIALFATGEYMSSSLFLARALEIFPEYAKVRVDLVAIIGDRDTVENRILDVREWTTRSDSGELEFLLSYIYYQMDRMEFAKQMIKKAAEKMPDSAAVAAMKKAIDERAANP